MKVNTQLRQESIKRVLSEIRQNGPISKRELQKITGFSWGNISSITALLNNEKYIMTSGKQETYVGRKPEELDININDNYIIGIDFNSQGILAVLCDLKGREIAKYETRFKEKNKNYALCELNALIGKIIKENEFKNIAYIAVAMQGKVDTENGISVRISAIKGWENVHVCEELKSRFGIDTVMLHDPDCLLYTEKYFGRLKGSTIENAILLRIDHGIGIATMLNGKMYMGIKGKTCEIGTNFVPVKDTDKWDLLKNIIREDAVVKEYADLNKSCDDIARLARSGDSKAAEVFNKIGYSLGFALNNAISLLNPETVILFGDFIKYSDLFLNEAERVLEKASSEILFDMVLSELNNDSAAVGAALFAADRLIEKLNFTD